MLSSIENCILVLTGKRAPATICPSEVARAIAPDGFRALMPLVRKAATQLVERGEIVVTQKGKVVDVRTARGPIRLSRR